MRFVWVLLLCVVVGGMEHWCGVTPEWEEELATNVETSRRLDGVPTFKRSTSFGPLRIQVYYVNMTALGPTITSHLQDVIMPGVLKWYNNMLSVKNLQENWRASGTACSSSVSIPNAHFNPGIPDTDVVVYVRAINASLSSYVARGGNCLLDGNTAQNPMGGFLLINAAYYAGLSSEMEILILRHEIAHILAFSSILFPKYRQPDGTLYPTPMVTGTLREASAIWLTTPKVVEKAKAAYGCDTMTGVELEDYGGTGTASSHWDKRNMVNEFMVGSLNSDTIYSDITFAAFEDSGWYKVNYEYTDPLQFGRGRGCDFFNKKCVIGGVSQFPEFCDTVNTGACSFSNTRKASCNIATLTVAPELAYQYFTNPLVAGTDSTADYCPYFDGYADGDCKDRGPMPSFYQPLLFGEQLCDTCMCFTGTYILPNHLIANPNHYGCHNVTCGISTATVRVGNSTITCPAAGGQVTGITGYSGYINCPPFAKLCGDRPCINACFGYGKCVLGNCQCNDGYSAIDCSLICYETCNKCTGTLVNNCVSCYPNAHLVSNSCICDDGFTYNSTSKRCEPCNISCKTCSGFTSTQCSACVDNASLAATGECLCNSGFTRSNDGKTCPACYATCVTCTGMLATSCNSCKSNASLPGASTIGACTCDSGFFLKTDSSCGACNVLCKECTAETTTACTACKPITASVSNGACVCPDGFYLSADGTQCLECDVTCKTCTGATASTCTACKPLTATVTSGVCGCPIGFFLSTDGAECTTCDVSCKGCTGLGNSLCTSCKPTNAVLSSGACGCPSGFYMSADWSLCPACDSNCVTCTQAGSSGCTSCYPLATLTPTPGPGACLCDERYYYAIPGGCLSCHFSCKTCSGNLATQCLTCQSGVPSGGQCTCASGMFMSQSSYCQSCSPNCATCVTAATQCLTCDTTVAALSGVACNCLSSAFLSATTQCVACHITCITCSAETDSSCKTCVSHSTLTAGACVCDAGYNRNWDYKTCVPCHYSCATCSGLSDSSCYSCQPSATLQANGKCTCNPGFYMKSDGTCTACHAQCATCTGPTNTQCLSCLLNATLQSGNSCTCNAGYYLKADFTCGVCNTLCATCSGPDKNTCLSCRSTATVQSGVCVCPSHQFLSSDGQLCVECDVTCLSCSSTGSSACLTCYPLGILTPSSGPGQCSCSAGLFYVPPSGCRSCDITCSQCSGIATNQCTSCPVGAAIDGTAPSYCKCISGYFASANRTCSVCAPNCIACVDSASKCTSCDPLVASLVSNVCVCISSAFKSSTGLCLPCDPTCATCSSASSSSCLSCLSNAAVATSPGACLCLSSFFPNPTVATCTACDIFCRECTSAATNHCTACFSPATLTPGGSCQCPDGFYPQGSNGNCVACSRLCKTCSGPSETQCNACLTSAKLVGAAPNLCACLDGFFPSPDQASCTACDSSCATCSSASPFFCLTCATGYMWVSGLYCLSVCPAGETLANGYCTAPTANASFRVQFDRVSQTLTDTVGQTVVQSGSTSASDTNDPTAYYQQGWLFDGSASYAAIAPNSVDTRNVALDSTHVVEAWIRPAAGTNFGCVLSKAYVKAQTANVLIRLCVTDTSKLQLDVAMLDLTGASGVVTKTLVAGTVPRANGWTSVSYRLLLSAKSSTKATILINQVAATTMTYNGLAYLDTVGAASTVKFLIGATYASGLSLGSVFKGDIAEVTIYNWDAVVASVGTCACAACTTGGTCLSLCMPTEFFNVNSCQPCMTSCTSGCIRGTDCRLNVDPLCSTYSTFVGCTSCSDLSAATPSGCQCITNTLQTLDKCSCLPDYPRTVTNQCGECRNYLSPTDVSAYFDQSYLMVVIGFAKQMVSTAALTCDLVFNAAILAKMGTGPVCNWASDELSLTVILGTGATILNEKVSLKAINLYARTGTCTLTAVALEPVLAYKYPLPAPVAILAIPSTYSLPCSLTSTLDLDGSASSGGKGRALNYTWTLLPSTASADLSIYQNYATVDSILKIPNTALSNALVAVTLTVTDFLGGVNSVTATVTVTTGVALSLQIDGGSVFTMKHTDTRVVSATSFNLCTNSILYYTWSFLQSTPASTLSSTSFLTTRSTINSITIPAKILNATYSYTFQASVTDDVHTSGLQFTATVVKSDLVAGLDRIDSDVSNGVDYTVTGVSSYDPDESPGALAYSWSCLDSGLPCLDPTGKVAVVSQTLVSLTIPAAQLKPSSTWTITLSVSKDTRISAKSVIITIKANVSTTFTNIYPTPSRINSQVKNQLTLGISALKSTTFLWTQELGTTLKLLSPLTYSYLLIGANAMSYGVAYGFMLTATNAQGVSTAIISFKANYPPSGGKTTISPATGTALTTLFEIRSTGWGDVEGDLPIVYTIFYTYLSTSVVVSSKSLSNYFSFKSGVGTYYYYSLVYDSIGSQTTVFIGAIKVAARLRQLEETSVLERFHLDTLNSRVLFHMVRAYTTVYQFDNQTFAGVLASVESFVDQLPSADGSQVESLIGGVAALFSQTDQINAVSLARIFAVVDAMVAKVETGLTEEQLKYVFWLVGELPTGKGPLAEMAQAFWQKYIGKVALKLMPDEVALTYSTSARSSFYQRVAVPTLSSVTYSAGKSKLALPVNLTSMLNLSPEQAVDVHYDSVLYTNATSEEISVGIFAAGGFSNYLFVANDNPAEIVVRNLSKPIGIIVPLHRYVENITYECQYQDSPGHWSPTGLNLTTLTPLQANCSSTHLTSFRVDVSTPLPSIPGTPDTTSPTDPTSNSHCRMNPAPIAISFSALILGVMLITYLRTTEPVFKSLKVDPQWSENRHETEAMKEKVHSPTISTVVSTEGPIVIDYQNAFKPTFSRAFCETHGVIGMWIYSSDLLRWSKPLIMLTSFLVQMCIIGSFYDRNEGEESHSMGYIWTSYGWSDVVHVAVGLAVGLGSSVILLVLFSIARRRRTETLETVFTIAGFVFAIGFVITAVTMTVFQDLNLCFEEGGRWAICSIGAFIGEILINQSLLGLGRAVAFQLVK